MSQHIYKTLHRTERGFIAQCNSCKEIQVLFGNYFTWMQEQHFFCFLNALNQLDKHNENLWVEIEEQRKIMIKTPAANVMTAFTEEEFDEFSDLMNMSAVMLHSESIINH